MYEYVAARRLATQLGAELASTRAGGACILTVHPGNMVPQYGCSCGDAEHEGIAWARVVNSFLVEAGSFPRAMSGLVQGGRALQLAAVIELGVDRCYANTEENEMPEPVVLDSLARDASEDAAAMRRAALGAGFDDVVVAMWLPRGPMGGIHGGTMNVTVLIDQCAPGQPMPPLDAVLPMLDGDPRAAG